MLKCLTEIRNVLSVQPAILASAPGACEGMIRIFAVASKYGLACSQMESVSWKLVSSDCLLSPLLPGLLTVRCFFRCCNPCYVPSWYGMPLLRLRFDIACSYLLVRVCVKSQMYHIRSRFKIVSTDFCLKEKVVDGQKASQYAGGSGCNQSPLRLAFWVSYAICLGHQPPSRLKEPLPSAHPCQRG